MDVSGNVDAENRNIGIYNKKGKVGQTWDIIYVDEMPDEVWDKMISVNLTSCFNLTKQLLPKMAERKFGVIIQVASVAGIVGSVTGASHYAAAKGGLIPFIRSL